MRNLTFSVCACALLTAATNCGALAAEATHLWTVQATDTGTETVCDAFAQGAYNRPLYEFRFRRSKSDLLFIVSYDGKVLPDQSGNASIIIDGREHVVPAASGQFGHFGARNAFIVTFRPGSVNFSEFDKDELIVVKIGGEAFELAFREAEHLSQGFANCLHFAHIE